MAKAPYATAYHFLVPSHFLSFSPPVPSPLPFPFPPSYLLPLSFLPCHFSSCSPLIAASRSEGALKLPQQVRGSLVAKCFQVLFETKNAASGVHATAKLTANSCRPCLRNRLHKAQAEECLIILLTVEWLRERTK